MYVPFFGLCADYLALLARPLTRRATAGWAKQAAYRKPPSRKERKVDNEHVPTTESFKELCEVCIGGQGDAYTERPLNPKSPLFLSATLPVLNLFLNIFF